MKIFNYLQFITESSEKILLPVVFSNEFKDKLDNIGNSFVASSFKQLYDSEVEKEYTLISIGGNEDTITYTDSHRLKDYKGDLRKIKSSDELWKKNRTEIKVGRFINKFFPKTFTDKAIEDFVNKWKSSSNENLRFDIWSGIDIVEGYKSKNYAFHSGPLGNSCMNDETYLITFYAYCPTAKLLVLLDEDDKILARALLWEDHEQRKIMDRVYYTEDKYYYRFVRWAEDNDYFYKKLNSGHINCPFVKAGSTYYLKTKVRIPNCFDFAEEGFPFLDTFVYGVGDWAQNYEPTDVDRYFIFNETDGTYREETVLRDVHGNFIDCEDYFVWSNTQGGLIDMEKSYKVEYGSRSRFPEHNFDDWIEVDYLDDPKNGFVKVDSVYYRKKDCVFSNKENQWIWIPQAIKKDGDWVSIYGN